MKVMGYGDMDVPALVEKPQIYILGRCSAKEVDQCYEFECFEER